MKNIKRRHSAPTVPEVTRESLERIFTVPESADSTLGVIEKQISENLLGFLKEKIVASDKTPAELESQFSDSMIPEEPVFVSEQAAFLMDHVVSQSVHTASPKFIGHMASALPYFMLPLSKIMIALNQNLVKTETSKSFTPLERQVIAMLHRLVYQRPSEYYDRHVQNPEAALGSFCSNGTIANITSLWVAVNKLFRPEGEFEGVAQDGLFAALQHYEKSGVAVLVSERGHYSLKKAANLLGIGKKNLISVPVDDRGAMMLSELRKTVDQLKKKNFVIAAVVGIAGSTETGCVDPLHAMAQFCQDNHVHFHVDAAWGGPTLFSHKHSYLLRGIERADSVTFDGHKQLYTPMGAAFALFKDESDLSLVAHHAEYIIRKGSRDLGRTSLEGSRSGMAMLVHSGLRIMGRKGYQLLIDTGIETAQKFAQMIESSSDFELMTLPELNILTYRYLPEHLAKALKQYENAPEQMLGVNEKINKLTVHIQKQQRERGQSFVSRTSLNIQKYNDQKLNVFRVVLANPLTEISHLQEVLDEQRKIAQGFEDF